MHLQKAPAVLRLFRQQQPRPLLSPRYRFHSRPHHPHRNLVHPPDSRPRPLLRRLAQPASQKLPLRRIPGSLAPTPALTMSLLHRHTERGFCPGQRGRTAVEGSLSAKKVLRESKRRSPPHFVVPTQSLKIKGLSFRHASEANKEEPAVRMKPAECQRYAGERPLQRRIDEELGIIRLCNPESRVLW